MTIEQRPLPVQYGASEPNVEAFKKWIDELALSGVSFISKAEFMRRLGCGVTKLHELKGSAFFPEWRKDGHYVKFAKHEVEAYLWMDYTFKVSAKAA